MKRTEWIRCPVCGSKTRLQMKDTELKNFPLFCPKCKQETLINLPGGGSHFFIKKRKVEGGIEICYVIP